MKRGVFTNTNANNVVLQEIDDELKGFLKRVATIV
jgi:hypothetical protein